MIDTGPCANEIREVLGTAYHAAGRFADAVGAYKLALEAASGGPERARILAQIGEVYATQWNIQPHLDAVYQGLGELGRALPTNPVLLVLTSIGRFLAGMFVAATRLGFGTARGEQAARYELEARLYDGLAVAAIHDTRPLLNVVATLRMLYPAARRAVQAIRWSAGVHQCPARDDGFPQLSRRARPGPRHCRPAR